MSTRRIFSSSGNCTLPSQDMLSLHGIQTYTYIHSCCSGQKHKVCVMFQSRYGTDITACIKEKNLKCGPIPNVMATLLNIGGTMCESFVIPFLVPCHKVWLTPTTRVPCSNAANIGECKNLYVKSILHLVKIPLGARAH